MVKLGYYTFDNDTRIIIYNWYASKYLDKLIFLGVNILSSNPKSER